MAHYSGAYCYSNGILIY